MSATVNLLLTIYEVYLVRVSNFFLFQSFRLFQSLVFKAKFYQLIEKLFNKVCLTRFLKKFSCLEITFDKLVHYNLNIVFEKQICKLINRQLL